MTFPQQTELPIDPVSAAALTQQGLRFALAAPEGFGAWFQAVGRGFHELPVDDARLSQRAEAFADRRMSAIYDDAGADAATPVGTVSAWLTDLTLPGGLTAPAWAISTLTVAPTHRRRGIARQIIASELRTAVALGAPLAILTASEATIYTRWGFSPATLRADWRIDVTKARWTGPVPGGRVQLVPASALREVGHQLHDRVRLTTPGQIRLWGILWDRILGMPGEDEAKHLRIARYDDERGEPQGFVVYRVDEDANHVAVLTVTLLVAATDDASAALWRFVLELDLVSTVVAPLRPVDEPARWMVDDLRSFAKTDERDHLWVRVLDTPAALQARRYSAAGRMVLAVDDPLGHAGGVFALEVDEHGVGVVSPAAEEEATVRLGIGELGSLLLGGVTATALARAGRLEQVDAGAAASLDRSFAAEVTPWLGTWF